MATFFEKLLENAWDSTAVKAKTVIALGKKTSEGKTVYYLRDNGRGFDMKYADQLFMPFRKPDIGEEQAGLGIGLNIAHRIITRHGGEIWAENNPGEGTVFFFILPQ